MNETQTIQWAKKVSDMMHRYFAQKKKLMKKLLKAGGEHVSVFSRIRMVGKPNNPEIQNIEKQIRVLVLKNQIPLFNNIINYGSMVRATLHQSFDRHIMNVKRSQHMVDSFLRWAKEYRALLFRQNEFLQSHNPLSQKDLENFDGLWLQEEHSYYERNRVKKPMMHYIKSLSKKTKSIYAQLKDFYYSAGSAHQKYKPIMVWVYRGTIAISALSLVLGVDMSDVTDPIKKVSQILTGE